MAAERIPAAAAWLGYSGIVPFAALAVMHVIDMSPFGLAPLSGFLIYSAVILSFLGGIRWGAVASGEGQSMPGLALSVMPSLWALFVVWLAPAGLAVGLMGVGFALMGMADWRWPARGLAPWMRRLRLHLSLAVIACHLVVILG